MTPSDLKGIGLTTKEAGAYMALLEIGEASMGQLVRKSRLKRTTLYDILESLKERGLLSISKKNKKMLYIAESPKKLLEQADDNKKKIEMLLPELLSITNTLTKKPKIRYFEGLDGIKEVYKDILNFPEQKLQAWLAETMIEKFDKKFIEHHYIPKRLEKKIWAEVIASDTPLGREFKSKDQPALRTTRLIDPEKFPLAVEVSLYGTDRVGIMSVTDELGLIIESKPIAKTLRSIFSAQWESLT